MCNLYASMTGQRQLTLLTKTLFDRTGNLQPLSSIFPDQMAPIVRNTVEGRELMLARWGMPGPPQFGGAPVTNIRNVKSPHWRRWLGTSNRCVVPFSSFCEYAPTTPKKTPTWFALDVERSPAFFAGIWAEWDGVRGTKASPVEGKHVLYGFLTTDANAEVAPIHPKAMPVILRTQDEIDAWLTLPTPEAMAMQRPLPDGTLKIVATGDRKDASSIV